MSTVAPDQALWSCLFVKLVLLWESVKTTPSLQYRLRREACHLHHNFPWSGTALSSRMLLSFREKRNGQWRLFDVSCRVQLSRPSWSFSRRWSERSSSELSSGFRPRLLALTGAQRGEALHPGLYTVALTNYRHKHFVIVLKRFSLWFLTVQPGRLVKRLFAVELFNMKHWNSLSIKNVRVLYAV